MNESHPQHQETPLDLDVHEGETKSKVWVRRTLFGLVIVLCVSFAAPQFGSCSGALGRGGTELWGTFRTGSEVHEVWEGDFRRTFSRVAAVARMFDPQARVDDDLVWRHIILDAAAREQGIVVTDEQVLRRLAMHPVFQVDGKFDEAKYRAEIRQLAKYASVDHEGFTSALRSFLRTEIYANAWSAAFSVPQSRDAWEEWKKSHVKVSADWVVQPFAPLHEKSSALPVTDDDLRRVANLPEVAAMRTIPGRRGIEAAYLRVRDITDAQSAAMEKFVTENRLLGADQTLEIAAWTQFWANRQPGSGPYTRETWRTLRQPEYEKALREWEALPEPRPEKPKEPGSDWPEQAQDEFDRHWAGFVSREVLAREVLRHMGQRAERESKPLAEIVPAYEAFGVRVVTTPEPVADSDLVEKFPEGLCRDSELEQAIRVRFRVPAAGQAFAPAVLPEPVPACMVSSRPQDRGWVVARWTSWDPPKEKDVLEPSVRAQAEPFFRKWRANELARDALAGVRREVEAAGKDLEPRREALRKAAAAAGLEVRSIRRFNRNTRRGTVPVVAADAAPEARRAAESITWRNRVLDDYEFLSRQEPGALRDPILIDDPIGAAFLMLVTERYEPAPVEMDDATTRMQRYLRGRQDMQEFMKALSFEEVRRRFALELTEAGRKATERAQPTNEEEGGTEGPSAPGK